MKTRLLHARVTVSDLHAAWRFYGRILGFEEAGAYPPDAPTYVEFAAADGAVFAIEQCRPGAASPTGATRLTFVVPDVPRLWTRWRGVVDAIEPFDDVAAEPLRFVIRDPDGNELGFVQE